MKQIFQSIELFERKRLKIIVECKDENTRKEARSKMERRSMRVMHSAIMQMNYIVLSFS